MSAMLNQMVRAFVVERNGAVDVVLMEGDTMVDKVACTDRDSARRIVESWQSGDRSILTEDKNGS